MGFHTKLRPCRGSDRRPPRPLRVSPRAGGAGGDDLERPYGAPRESGYVESLLAQADLVERDLAANHSTTATLVRDAAELEAARAEDRIAFVHCVEGGLHLGPTPEAVCERRAAGAPGRRLPGARPPGLARGGDERERHPVHPGPALPAGLPPAQARPGAIGSDIDGFIKPTLAGLATMADMKRLEAALIGRYGARDGELISSGNALRPMRSYWGAR